jgi:integrase
MIIRPDDALRRVLAAFQTERRRSSPTAGIPWTENSFGSAFNRAKIDAGMEDRDLHFHDLRGTAATRFYIAGRSVPVIAGVMAGRRNTSKKSSAATSQPRRLSREK